MSCNITSGLNAQLCKNGSGGVIEFYITNFENLSAYTEANSYVTAISLSAGTTYYKYKSTKNTADWMQSDTSVDNSAFEQTVTMVFNKNESADINNIKVLAKANCSIIVKDRDLHYYLLGANEGMEVVEATFNSGKIITDPATWTMTFKGYEKDPAPQINPAIIAALVTV